MCNHENNKKVKYFRVHECVTPQDESMPSLLFTYCSSVSQLISWTRAAAAAGHWAPLHSWCDAGVDTGYLARWQHSPRHPESLVVKERWEDSSTPHHEAAAGKQLPLILDMLSSSRTLSFCHPASHYLLSSSSSHPCHLHPLLHSTSLSFISPPLPWVFLSFFFVSELA